MLSHRYNFISVEYKNNSVNIRGEMIGRRCASTSQPSTTLLQEKQVKPQRNKMTSSNINKYVSKCYINLFNIVLAEIGSNPFSYAFITLCDGVLEYKKIMITCFHLHNFRLFHLAIE